MMMERVRTGAVWIGGVIALMVLSIVALAILLIFILAVPGTFALLIHFEESVTIKTHILSLVMMLVFVIALAISPKLFNMDIKYMMVYTVCLTIVTSIAMVAAQFSLW